MLNWDPTKLEGKIEFDGFWLPRQGAELAKTIDAAWDIVFWVSVILFFVVMVPVCYFAVKYRRRSEHDVTSEIDHNLKLEIIWTVLPSILVIWLFFVGLRGYIDASVPPGGAYEIQVEAQRWNWSFIYPEGFRSPKLVLPSGRPVKLILASKDVLHSFYIPAFRTKQDVVPGLYTTLWFEPLEPMKTVIFCTEYCGKDHSNMLADAEIMSPGDFQSWLRDYKRKKFKETPPVKLGEQTFAERGCPSCHGVGGEGTAQAPPLKGLFGRNENLADGTTVMVEENYLRESILAPSAKVVRGFQPIMPPFQGTLEEPEILGLIEFIKTLK